MRQRTIQGQTNHNRVGPTGLDSPSDDSRDVVNVVVPQNSFTEPHEVKLPQHVANLNLVGGSSRKSENAQPPSGGGLYLGLHLHLDGVRFVFTNKVQQHQKDRTGVLTGKLI
jgi:hypothetical protein